MDLRPIFTVLGGLLCVLAAGMMLSALVDFDLGNADWQVFVVCAGLTSFCGFGLILTNRAGGLLFTIRQAFVFMPIAWVSIALFAAMPFSFCSLALAPVDAFFEAMSGITTTGSTVIKNLSVAPPGILLWRAVLQWMGGFGFILMSLSILPFLGVGGMQIFKSDLSEGGGMLSRMKPLLASFFGVYVGLTILCALGYAVFSGMGGFDALVHAMATISTGGASTSNESLAHWDSVGTRAVATLFMFLGCMPFFLLLKALHGQVQPLTHNPELRVFCVIVLGSIGAVALWLFMHEGCALWDALWSAAFNVVSVISGTGFVIKDYGTFGAFPQAFFLCLMVIGGCAGSSTGGIKVFRLYILLEMAYAQLRSLLHSSGVFIAHYGDRPIPSDVPTAVMGFLFLYAAVFFFLALGLSLCGLDFMTAISGALSSLSNLGPGLGPVIGPMSSFVGLPDAAKWLLCAGMLLGRLEILPVLILLVPPFWKR